MTSLTTIGEKRTVPQAATTTATTTFAPASKRPRGSPPSNSVNSVNGELLRCKRRIHFGYTLPQPAAVARRNERERNRVRMVNMGFATLKQHVPKGANNKKMSKVETLKSAVEYIKKLQEILGEGDGTHNDENSGHCYQNEKGYVVGQSPDCSGASSPSPSIASDASSPYDNFSPEEEDLLQDFAAWFS